MSIFSLFFWLTNLAEFMLYMIVCCSDSHIYSINPEALVAASNKNI